MKKIFRIVPYLLVAILVGVTITYAGNLTPPGPAENTMYTLTNLYNLASGATATLGSGDIPSTPGTVEATGKTLTQVYDGIVAQINLLANGKIAKDISAFGFTGTLYGDTDASKVLASATYAGTVATRTLSSVSETVSAGYYDATTLSAVDADLATGNILSGKTIFGIAGSVNAGYTYGDATQAKVLTTATGAGTYDASNLAVGTVKSGTAFGVSSTGDYPSVTYPLSGDTGATDATATEICNTNEAWTKAGALITGSFSPTAAYIATGNTYCGTAGTLLANLWNGTSGAFTGGSQADGGADDYNNGEAVASGRYAKGWTACNAGNSYCGTSDSGADAKDDSTGLVWSLPCNGSGCASFSDSSPLTYSWSNGGANNNSRTASQLCSDHSGWSLPHQKQLMQAYIDGSYGNLETASVFRTYWSASTLSYGTTTAWRTGLSDGYTTYNAKTSSFYVRCVR